MTRYDLRICHTNVNRTLSIVPFYTPDKTYNLFDHSSITVDSLHKEDMFNSSLLNLIFAVISV